MYYVYVLRSLKDNEIYTGYSSNLKSRIDRHNAGLVISTKNRRPLKLVYYQAFLSKKDATKEEIYLKSGGKAKNNLKTRIKSSLII